MAWSLLLNFFKKLSFFVAFLGIFLTLSLIRLDPTPYSTDEMNYKDIAALLSQGKLFTGKFVPAFIKINNTYYPSQPIGFPLLALPFYSLFKLENFLAASQPLYYFSTGFYPPKNDDRGTFYWLKDNGTILVYSKKNDLVKMGFSGISFGKSRRIKIIFKNYKNYGKIVYPGGTFPNNYRELEKFRHGGFFIVEVDGNNIKVERRDIKSCDVIVLTFDAQNKTPEKVEEELREAITDLDVKDKVVLIRVEGVLISGSVTEIGLRDIIKTLKENNARITRVNTNKLSTKEYEEISIEQASTKEELEDKLIKEQVGQYELGKLSVDKRIELTKSLLQLLSEEKNEGERTVDYKARIFDGATKILGIKKELEALK